MEPERLPISKVFNTPFLSLDGTSVEAASLMGLFLVVVVIAGINRRRQLVRRVVQLVSLFFFFYVVYSCLGVFGMIRNGLYGLTLLGSAYSESFYWLALPVAVIASTLISGPVFCGWICPTGTLQEWTAMLRRRVGPPVGTRPTVRQRILLAACFTGFLALVIQIGVGKKLFVEDSSLHWAAALLLLCWLVLTGAIDDLPTRSLRALSIVAIFISALSHLIITSPVHFAFTARDDPASALATLVIMVASFFVLRGWCRYLCPWGYLMGFLHRFSRLRVVRVPSRCNDCGTCAGTCDIGAIDAGKVRTEHCQFCLACVDHCPRGAMEVRDVWPGLPDDKKDAP